MVYIGIDLGLVNGGVTLSLGTQKSKMSIFSLESKLSWIEQKLLKKLKKDTGFSVTSNENYLYLTSLHQSEVIRPIKGAVYLYDEPTTFLIDWSANEVHMRGTKVLAAKKAMLAGVYFSELQKLGTVEFFGPGKLRESLKNLADKPGNLSKEQVWAIYLTNQPTDLMISEVEFWNELNEHERDSAVLAWAYWRLQHETR